MTNSTSSGAIILRKNYTEKLRKKASLEKDSLEKVPIEKGGHKKEIEDPYNSSGAMRSNAAMVKSKSS